MKKVIPLILLSVLLGLNLSYGQVKSTSPQVSHLMISRWMSPAIEIGTESTDIAKIFVTNMNKHMVRAEIIIYNAEGKVELTKSESIPPSGMIHWNLDRKDVNEHYLYGWVEIKANGDIYPSGYILVEEFHHSAGEYGYNWNTSVSMEWYRLGGK